MAYAYMFGDDHTPRICSHQKSLICNERESHTSNSVSDHALPFNGYVKKDQRSVEGWKKGGSKVIRPLSRAGLELPPLPHPNVGFVFPHKSTINIKNLKYPGYYLSIAHAYVYLKPSLCSVC